MAVDPEPLFFTMLSEFFMEKIKRKIIDKFKWKILLSSFQWNNFGWQNVVKNFCFLLHPNLLSYKCKNFFLQLFCFRQNLSAITARPVKLMRRRRNLLERRWHNALLGVDADDWLQWAKLAMNLLAALLKGNIALRVWWAKAAWAKYTVLAIWL